MVEMAAAMFRTVQDALTKGEEVPLSVFLVSVDKKDYDTEAQKECAKALSTLL